MRRRVRKSPDLFERVRCCPIGELPMILDAVMESIVDHIRDYYSDDRGLDSQHIRDAIAVGRAYDSLRSVVAKVVGGRIHYAAYLESNAWKRMRAVMLEKAGGRCQVCNRDRRLNVHHRTYERIGNEIPDDLIVLCEPCHKLFHENGRLAKT